MADEHGALVAHQGRTAVLRVVHPPTERLEHAGHAPVGVPERKAQIVHESVDEHLTEALGRLEDHVAHEPVAHDHVGLAMEDVLPLHVPDAVDAFEGPQCRPDPFDERVALAVLPADGEYADTRLVEKLGPVFFERVVRPKLMKQQTDEVRVKKVLAEDVPPVLDYLEEQVGDKEFLVGGRFTIADVAVATQLQQLDHGGEAVNASQRPRLASYAERILTRPSFKACIEQEKQMFASM